MTPTETNPPGDPLLPRPPGVFRRWLAAHPRTVDWIIVGTYVFGCAAMMATELLMGRAAATASPWLAVDLAITLLVAAALLMRRRFPLGGVILISALQFFEQGLLVLPNSVALVFLLYAVPVHRTVTAGWIAFTVASLSSAALIQLTGGSGTGLIGPAGIAMSDGAVAFEDRLLLTVANALWLLAVLMIGITLGNRRRYVEALIDRAHQLARDREQRARLAAAAERARIAREMHDIVAHSLSVVVTLSEAAAVAIDTQPSAAKQALERSAETGRTALAEMRRLLGVLAEEREDAHDDGSRLAPQPDLAQLGALVDGFAEAGLRVFLSEVGASTGDATHQLAIYRIVQEALTNALRHAGAGAEVRVTLAHDPGSTRIEVIDSGPAHHPAPAAMAIPGSGRGLEGARQRARLFGGDLQAGPHGPGWRIVATVPPEIVPPEIVPTGRGTA